MLGPEAVVTAVPVGGRTPTERVRWVPWGEERMTEVQAPWPGAVPGPAPARVFDPPLPADLLDADGRTITVNGRGEPSAAPVVLRCAALPNGGGALVAWAGPWPHDLRWWEPAEQRRVRCCRWSSTAGARPRRLVAVRGRAEIEAIYD